MRSAAVFLVLAAAAFLLLPGGGARAQSVNWTGLWDTRTGAGNQYIFRLQQSGSSVTGTAQQGPRTWTLLNGTANGLVLTFTIDIGSGQQNRYEFIMAGDGNSFTGRWGYNSDPPGVYNGARGAAGGRR